MVRKKSPVKADQLMSVESFPLQSLAEDWLARIRVLLPESGTAVVSVHKLPRHRFLVSFRASAYGETFISEAREGNLELGLEAAGTRLFERLAASPPQPKALPLGDRVREFLKLAPLPVDDGPG